MVFTFILSVGTACVLSLCCPVNAAIVSKNICASGLFSLKNSFLGITQHLSFLGYFCSLSTSIPELKGKGLISISYLEISIRNERFPFSNSNPYIFISHVLVNTKLNTFIYIYLFLNIETDYKIKNNIVFNEKPYSLSNLEFYLAHRCWYCSKNSLYYYLFLIYFL